MPMGLDPEGSERLSAAKRAQQRSKYRGMTPAQMCQAMGDKELMTNVRRGGVAAIAELERRDEYADHAGDSPAVGNWTQELEDAENIWR